MVRYEIQTLMLTNLYEVKTQLTLSRSKSALETLEKGVKYVQS